MHCTLRALKRLWEGNQVLEQVVDLTVHEFGGGGYLVLSLQVARVTTTWAHAQLQGGVRHGLEVSSVPNFWPFEGDEHTP